MASAKQRVCGTTTPPVPLKPMSRVAVCGGTFGNKMAGVYLAKEWLKDPSELRRQTFSATPFLVNPRAAEKLLRYVEKDIGVCFLDSILKSPDTHDTPYEEKRAKEINRLFGPKGSDEAYDLLLDMHTSPCNMGACIIVDNAQNYFAMHLARYVQKHFAVMKAPIYLNMSQKEKSGRITSIARCGIGLELGPVSLERLRAEDYKHMRTLINCCLDFTDKFNQGGMFPAFEVEAYQFSGLEMFPQGPDGEVSAMVHPKIQDHDFLPVKPGNPVFQTFQGQDIAYSGDASFCPVFANDGALFRSKAAFVKTDKLRFSIPAIQATAKSSELPPEKDST
ncbi:N-acyl-aromatic-L-amino acid amidohydrolase (carboxylate-forming)-like [Ambystoma mexicanum]|uniref:N-acyl-aromatic-L-amino acid amidohydrolase (carboxylate-forming)-like n=1 Tax=Ambystoma mexicanum TaxID=8296 RepID=UPI0037E894A1